MNPNVCADTATFAQYMENNLHLFCLCDCYINLFPHFPKSDGKAFDEPVRMSIKNALQLFGDKNLIQMLYTYNLTLADTILYMNSSDYKDRFIGEYWQTRIRYDKLHDMTVRYEAGKLNFTPTCSLDLLKEQKKYMGLYLNKLEIRAFLEDINLAKPFMINNNMEG